MAAFALFVAAFASLSRRARRRAAPRCETLRFVANDLWALDQVCRALDAALRTPSELRHVTIDISAITTLDDSATAALAYACSRLEAAGVQICLETASSSRAPTLH